MRDVVARCRYAIHMSGSRAGIVEASFILLDHVRID